MLNNLQQMLLKLLQKEQFKTQQKQLVTLLVIKLLIELRKSKSSPQNNSKTIMNENDNEILRERCISPEERQKIIDDLRLI